MKELDFICLFKERHAGVLVKTKSFDIYPPPKEKHPFTVVLNGVELGCAYLHFDGDMHPPMVWVMYLKSFKEGNGSQILELLCRISDEMAITLYLEPAPDKGGKLDYSQLVSWYRRYGFVGEATMVRAPNA